jgi:hypothetical protein
MSLARLSQNDVGVPGKTPQERELFEKRLI